jgi:hypothetical protein
MHTDPRAAALRYLITQLRVRIVLVRSGNVERGALTLEWVAIAIVLVTVALALATFLTGKLGDLEKLIPN